MENRKQMVDITKKYLISCKSSNSMDCDVCQSKFNDLHTCPVELLNPDTSCTICWYNLKVHEDYKNWYKTPENKVVADRLKDYLTSCIKHRKTISCSDCIIYCGVPRFGYDLVGQCPIKYLGYDLDCFGIKQRISNNSDNIYGYRGRDQSTTIIRVFCEDDELHKNEKYIRVKNGVVFTYKRRCIHCKRYFWTNKKYLSACEKCKPSSGSATKKRFEG